MPESVNQEIELVERLQKRERKKPLARSWLTHFPGICPKKLTILVSWIIIVSCGYRPWDQNCRRTLLTQLTDRFFGRNSPSHGIFSCKRPPLKEERKNVAAVRRFLSSFSFWMAYILLFTMAIQRKMKTREGVNRRRHLIYFLLVRERKKIIKKTSVK